MNSHYWYGIVADCSLEEYDAHPPKLGYTIVFKNGDSHLPADEDGMFGSHVFVMMLLVRPPLNMPVCLCLPVPVIVPVLLIVYITVCTCLYFSTSASHHCTVCAVLRHPQP